MAATATSTSATSATSTNTYTSVVVSSFPFRPLTTQFVRPTYCDAIYNGNIYMIDPQENCLPESHSKQETAYYSPGYVCPEGYMTARVDNKGVRSITTVTCCPTRSDIILSALDPATLSGQWVDLFCTWIAPEPTRIDIVHTAGTSTWTQQEYVASPGGVNAYGVRMVYQSTDIAATATATISATSTGNGTAPQEADAPALSRAASITIAAVVPVVVLGLIAGALFWWWRKRQASKYDRVNEAAKPSASGMPPGNHQQGPVHEVPSMQQYQQGYQQHQHQPMQTIPSTQSFPSTYQSSTAAPSSYQHSPHAPYAQQYGNNGAYTSFAGYKPPGVAEEALAIAQAFTSELPAPVPTELAEDRPTYTASGQHIDDQKMMGMGPLR